VALDRSPDHHVDRLRLEMVMMLVTGSQLLHRLFVGDGALDAAGHGLSRFTLRRASADSPIC
jgi:hypothetical protein